MTPRETARRTNTQFDSASGSAPPIIRPRCRIDGSRAHFGSRQLLGELSKASMCGGVSNTAHLNFNNQKGIAMQIKIENIMGVGSVHAGFETGAPLVVFGRNEAGKTSLAAAVGAAVAREPNPKGLRSLKDYIRSGAANGMAVVKDDAGSIEWRPGRKDCFIENGENPPSSHPFAAGLIDLIGLKSAEDRAKFWEQCFMPALPVGEFRDDIMPAITGGGEPSEANDREFQSIVDDIARNGWDYVEKRYVEHGRSFKRQWQNAMASVGIHAKYGRKQAEAPDLPGWTADLEQMSIADAEREMATAQADLDAASVSDAVEAAVIETAKNAVEQLKPIAAEIAEKAPELETLVGRLERIKTEAQILKQTLKQDKPDADCPHCGKPLRVSGVGRDVEAFDGNLDAIKKHNDEVNEKLANLKDEYVGVKGEKDALGERLRELATLKSSFEAQIKAGEGKRAIKGDERNALSAAEDELEKARRNLDLVRARSEAFAAHASVQKVERLILRLKASGFRADQVAPKRNRVVDLVNKVFSGADWGTIEMQDADFSILYNGRPMELWSSSTRWRINAIFQAAVALMTRSSLLILDAADVLDDTNMAKFCKWITGKLSKNDVATIVCLTAEHEAFVSQSWGECTRLGLARHEAAL